MNDRLDDVWRASPVLRRDRQLNLSGKVALESRRTFIKKKVETEKVESSVEKVVTDQQTQIFNFKLNQKIENCIKGSILRSMLRTDYLRDTKVQESTLFCDQ